MTDGDLLQTYAATRSDDAFRVLIERYVRLVYSACCRQLKDPHLAEDATQAVFILLSRKAGSLRQDRISGWLLTTARYACANMQKMERRRQYRERVIAMHKPVDSGPDVDELAGLLDDALANLGAMDREAVVLRYLRDQSLREVGATLGVTEEAARKRVERAVEKLRHYFARRGIATTAAMLATLLPAQANAVTVTESLSQAILQTCHAGAASAAPAMALAKGTNMMMLAQSFKTATAAVFLFAAVILAGWWGVSAATRTTLAQTGTATVPAPANVLDLSSPEKTLESYCNAMKAADRAAVYACTTTDPNRTPTAGDAFLAMTLGQNHLIRAAAKAFNKPEDEVRQFTGLDQVLEKILAYDRSTKTTAIINGDHATLAFNLPDEMLKRFPEAVQPEIRAFMDHPIQFTKQGKEWKLGPSEAQVNIPLIDKQGQTVEDRNTQIAVITEYATIYDGVASTIDAGKFASWDDALAEFNLQREELHRKYNLAEIGIHLQPPASTPSTSEPAK